MAHNTRGELRQLVEVWCVCVSTCVLYVPNLHSPSVSQGTNMCITNPVLKLFPNTSVGLEEI